MMFAQTRLFVLLGLGALMTPALAADTATTPTCGDLPGPSVECSAGGKDWKCPPANTCGKESPNCEMTFIPCTPSAESTSTKAPPKTTSPATKSGLSTTSTSTGTSSAPTNTSSGNVAPGLVVGSWTAAVMGIMAGGLVI